MAWKTPRHLSLVGHYVRRGWVELMHSRLLILVTLRLVLLLL